MLFRSVKSQRLATLQDLLAEQQRHFNDTCVGLTLTVLLDRPGRHPGQLVGRSPYMQAVHVDAAAAEVGAIVEVRIDAALANSLGGTVVGSPDGGRAAPGDGTRQVA